MPHTVWPRSTAPRAPAPQQSTADRYLLRRHSNTVLSQSLWGLWVLVCTGMFEPSKHLWQVWGLILNVVLPLLQSFWGFSFAPGRGYLLKVTPAPHSCSSSAYHLAGASLPLDLKLINTSITLHSYFIITFFFMVGTFKIQSFSNFEVYVVLSIQFSVVLMLCLYQIIRDCTFRSFNDR